MSKQDMSEGQSLKQVCADCATALSAGTALCRFGDMADEDTLRGSCLCGGVKFEVALPFDRFVYCHCSRCRKATGTAHASNAVVEVGAFRWLFGEEQVSRFDLPTARSFATSFCRQCGSPLPHATRSGREVIIPAGALDDDPVSKPDRHVHWQSRATWYVHGQGLPEER